MAMLHSYTREWFPALSTSVIKVCCLFTLILCSQTSSADELEDLTVTAADGEYSLRVAVVLNAPADYVYKVITDYKHAYRINPAITNVEILPSGRDRVIRVRNRSEQCVGPFCFAIIWTGDIVKTGKGDLEVKTIPQLGDFISGSAIWRIRARGEHAWVLYVSRLKPAFFIPPVIGDIVIKKHIKSEILASFKRIECQAVIMLALDMEHQPYELEQLARERKECLNPLG
jgi:hypothetical protein